MAWEKVADTTPGAHAARSQLYQCFASAFSHPGEDLLNSIFSGQFLNTLVELGHRLPYATPFEVPAINEIDSPALQGVSREFIGHFYTTHFESGGHAISLRESSYSSLTEKALMEEIFRFYHFFGLDLSNSHLRELPDTLPIELEFLHYLTYLQAKTLDAVEKPSNSAALQRGQKDFLQQHLGKWLGPFTSKLQRIGGATFYAGAANLLHQFIRSEEQFLSISD
jgi:DMSO reductase family type II enzyme chaperone